MLRLAGMLAGSMTLLAGLAGCAPWRDSPAAPPDLPVPPAAPDSVWLEIAFVRLGVDGTRSLDELWQDLDEQHLPAHVRRTLRDNGYRCGRAGVQLPAALRPLLDQPADDAITGLQGDLEAPVQLRRLQSRTGRRSEIVTSGQRDEMVILLQEGGRLAGRSLRDAQCLFAAKTFPLGDGRVRLVLTPEVHHGQPQQRWVGRDGAFLLEAGRAREVFEKLRIETVVAPGQTLVLSCTSPAKGLGKHFFLDPTQGRAHEKLLLIRLAQSQRDDLFDADATVSEPLTTH